jgi:hypothetical protein
MIEGVTVNEIPFLGSVTTKLSTKDRSVAVVIFKKILEDVGATARRGTENYLKSRVGRERRRVKDVRELKVV